MSLMDGFKNGQGLGKKLLSLQVLRLTIPSPKIVEGFCWGYLLGCFCVFLCRYPRPDENTAPNASAPTSLQGSSPLNNGRGNPAPTQPYREPYLKILSQPREGIFIYKRLEHHGPHGLYSGHIYPTQMRIIGGGWETNLPKQLW